MSMCTQRYFQLARSFWLYFTSSSIKKPFARKLPVKVHYSWHWVSGHAAQERRLKEAFPKGCRQAASGTLLTAIAQRHAFQSSELEIIQSHSYSKIWTWVNIDSLFHKKGKHLHFCLLHDQQFLSRRPEIWRLLYQVPSISLDHLSVQLASFKNTETSSRLYSPARSSRYLSHIFDIDPSQWGLQVQQELDL